MLQRLAINDLVKWKYKTRRKPLLLDGARQVGKTYLISRLFGQQEFQKVHLLDFRRDPALSDLFTETLDPKFLLENFELHLNTKIDLDHDLVFFDEVGDCQKAVDSLKYFAEDFPSAYICATGSNIGLLQSFPVGSVHRLQLSPFSFEEFLMAKQNPRLLEAFRDRADTETVFNQIWSVLLDYYFVGGMPEAVTNWYDNAYTLAERVENVTLIHSNLVTGYRIDFAKYADRLNALHIDTVFNSVPRQLFACQDDSTNRFKFQGVVEHKRRYSELRGPIDWLEKSNLVRKCYPIQGKPMVPLQSRIRENIFKLFLFDIGLLCHMLDIPYRIQTSQKFQYKGYIAENFVLNELSVRTNGSNYSWQDARAEIEFIRQSRDGTVIPIEVKSSSRTKARSLTSYIERYDPQLTVILAGKRRREKNQRVRIWPLYDAQFIADL